MGAHSPQLEACRLVVAAALWIVCLPATLAARPAQHQLSPILPPPDIVGDPGARATLPAKAGLDTIWIADWTFDDGSPCNDTGWEKIDNRIRTDGVLHWDIRDQFAGVGGLSGRAAIVGGHDLCWAFPDGYANEWYTAIRIEYTGDTYLSFDYLVDAEPGFDFVQVEVDSGCASFARVDLHAMPDMSAADFRTTLFMATGLDTARVDSLLLTGWATPDTHCAYIAFWADGGFSPADGLYPPTLGIGAAVDNVLLEPAGPGGTSLFEDFEGPLQPAVSFENIQERTPFGNWGRLFPHIRDNDVCTENTTCSWLFTDDTTPTLANDPSMAFGPGQYVVRNWLDNIIVSPWISLKGTPGAVGTVLSFRRFPGNNFSTGHIMMNWSVRSRLRVDNTDSPAPGDSIVCTTHWQHATSWNSLSFFGWITSIANMDAYIDPAAADIQVRFRVSDWLRTGPPAPDIPGPGPFVDRVRIGRRFLTGPWIDEGADARSQAQDAFPADPVATSGPNATWVPTTDRFGTAPFSQGTELGINNRTPNLLVGDSIHVKVQDLRGAGGVTRVEFYGAIVAGPHSGNAPPPHSVSGDFFVVPADTVKDANGTIVADNYFVSLDDQYFRGGDVLEYFWLAEDAQGGIASDPIGLTSVPATLAEAEAATDGLLEVSFLPAINWDPAYLARIAADPHGKLDPTPAEIANSSQAHCVLYVQTVNTRRRSGDLNRTTFMYTLDNLGYRGEYDVYDHTGLGNTNNQLGGRATPEQATGYALIVYDMGNNGPSGLNMPDGTDLDAAKIDQGAWFQSWLAQAATSEAGIATLWVAGSNAMEERRFLPLYLGEMGAVFVSGDQALNVTPEVSGQADMTFAGGNTGSFSGDLFALDGGCPTPRNYDALDATGTAVVTHRWKDPSSATLGDAAVVMNANPAASWNTILQAFPFFDMRDPAGAGAPVLDFTDKLLTAVLPPACQQAPDPTDTGGGDGLDDVPARTVLHPNVPNPFNPVTTIAFDLARKGHVQLAIYDVAGRRVRTLVDATLQPGRDHEVVWNGTDDAGRRVASGVYLYRLVTPDVTATRKLVLAR